MEQFNDDDEQRACFGSNKLKKILTDAVPIRSEGRPSSHRGHNERMHKATSARGADVYNMCSGINYLLIFNHLKFKNDEMKKRVGGELDPATIRSTFEPLGFDVKECEDYTLSEIRKEMNIVAEKENMASLTLFICTHGESKDVLFAYDTIYSFQKEIMDKILPESCPSLVGKPRLIFIQACQGEGRDMGVKLMASTHKRKADIAESKSYSFPTHSDTFVMRASYPGHVSFRSTQKGSLFIYILCREINDSNVEDDLISILTRVTMNIARDFEANGPVYGGCKQIPLTESTLTRKIYLKSQEKKDT